jgi:hypothetical protein
MRYYFCGVLMVALLAVGGAAKAGDELSSETLAELQTGLRGLDALRFVAMGTPAGQRASLALYTGSSCIAHLGNEQLHKLVLDPPIALDQNGSAAEAVRLPEERPRLAAGTAVATLCSVSIPEQNVWYTVPRLAMRPMRSRRSMRSMWAAPLPRPQPYISQRFRFAALLPSTRHRLSWNHKCTLAHDCPPPSPRPSCPLLVARAGAPQTVRYIDLRLLSPKATRQAQR